MELELAKKPRYPESMHFGQSPRFELRDDGTIVARAGTQLNCAGIARIHVRISTTPAHELVLLPEHDPNWQGERYGSAIPGSAVPRVFLEAVFRGVAAAFERREVKFGVRYELLDALVHDVDANERRFTEVGYSSMANWIEHHYPDCWPSDG